MSKRTWFGLIVATFVMTASGAAFSGNPTLQSPVQVLDFDESTQVLYGLPPGQNAHAYLHTDQSVWLFSTPIQEYPSGPCRGIAVEWNRQVEFAADHGVDLEVRQSFIHLMLRMADHSCNTAISSDLSQNPSPIVSINPTP